MSSRSRGKSSSGVIRCRRALTRSGIPSRARQPITGKLVGRAVTGAVCHVYQHGNRFFPATGYPADALEAGRQLWVLHPSGDPLPEFAKRGRSSSLSHAARSAQRRPGH